MLTVLLNERIENNVTIIDFIDNLGDKIGQLVYEIIDNKATIHDTFIYPDYRRKGILKTHLPTILSKINQQGINLIELSTLNEEAKTAWTRLGFIETEPNTFVMNL